jgi:hypothetical protein
MTTLRIYDCRNDVLTVHLLDLLNLLVPRSLDARWKVSAVTLDYPQLGQPIGEFMVVGTEKLDLFAAGGAAVSGRMLFEAAHEAQQVIWGQFVATLSVEGSAWVTIRAIDSTFYEISSSDVAVIETVRSAYSDVRVASGPVSSCPIEPIHR